jgi:hypothetical protein
MNGFNGARVKRLLGTILVPLPREAWRSAGNCHCSHCKGREGFWDTLAVSTRSGANGSEYAWTVHAPWLR